VVSRRGHFGTAHSAIKLKSTFRAHEISDTANSMAQRFPDESLPMKGADH
jgi:hypothetical protein